VARMAELAQVTALAVEPVPPPPPPLTTGLERPAIIEDRNPRNPESGPYSGTITSVGCWAVFTCLRGTTGHCSPGRYGGRVPLPPSCGGCVPQSPLPGRHDSRDHHETGSKCPRFRPLHGESHQQSRQPRRGRPPRHPRLTIWYQRCYRG
jgi:hypothetical protein